MAWGEPTEINKRELELTKDYHKNTQAYCKICNEPLPKRFRTGNALCSFCSGEKLFDTKKKDAKQKRARIEEQTRARRNF